MENLLGFSGCEFYFQNWKEVNGLKFSEVLYMFEEAVPIGIEKGEVHNT